MHGRRKRPISALALALVLALGLAACGDDDDDDRDTATDTTAAVGDALEETRPADGEGGEAAGIEIEGFAFGEPVSAAPGSTVSVTNKDSVPHTVTADEGGVFDVRVDGGQSAELTAPDEPGTYAFHCEIHTNMKGELIVE